MWDINVFRDSLRLTDGMEVISSYSNKLLVEVTHVASIFQTLKFGKGGVTWCFRKGTLSMGKGWFDAYVNANSKFYILFDFEKEMESDLSCIAVITEKSKNYKNPNLKTGEQILFAFSRSEKNITAYPIEYGMLVENMNELL